MKIVQELYEKKLKEYANTDLFVFNSLDRDRDFAVDMLKKLRKADPTIFNFYGPSCFVNKCTEGAMTCGKATEVIEKFKKL